MKSKCLLLVLSYLGVIPLKTRTKLQLAFESVLNCLKIEIAFKCQIKFSNHFRFKDRLREDLISGLELFISFSVVSALSRNMERV